MIKPDYYESFLNNLPPEESVKGVVNFIEFLQKHYIDLFKNIVEESKDKLIQIQDEPKNVCNELQIEINSRKDKETDVEHTLSIIVGKDYDNPLKIYEGYELFNDSDCFLSIECLFKTEEKANEIMKNINENIIPKIEEFQYYRAFKNLNGFFKFLQHKNRICLCLSRNSQIFSEFINLNLELQIVKFNFGINCELKFKCGLNISDTPNLSLEEFLEKILVFSINYHGKVVNYHEIITAIIDSINNLKDESSLLELKSFLSTILIVNKIHFNLEVNPNVKNTINYLVKHKFESLEELESLYKTLQTNVSITYDLFPIILEMFGNVGVYINKSDFNGITFSLCSNKLKSKISGEFIYNISNPI